MTELDLTIWRGMEIRHPGDWEVAVASPPGDMGRISLADRNWQRLDVTWRRLRGRPKLTELAEKFRDEHLKGFEKDAKSKKVALTDQEVRLLDLPDPPAGWAGFMQKRVTGTLVRALKHIPERELLIEIALLWPHRRNEQLEEAILTGLTPLPADAPTQRWRAMGIDVELDRPFRLELSTPQVGRIHWEFNDGAKHCDPLVIERTAMPESYINDTLANWLPKQQPIGSKVIQQFAVPVNGHPGQYILTRGQAGRMGSLRGRHSVRIETAWVCPLEDRLYRICRSCVTKGEAVPMPDSLELRCCQPSHAVVAQQGDSPTKKHRKATDASPLGDTRTTEQFLAAIPFQNVAMELDKRPGGHLLAKVQIDRPGWLVPPISWVIPYGKHRRVELDAVGAKMLDLCDGQRTVEKVIEKFAADHKLTFREAQLPVTLYLRQLTQRGVVAIVGGRADE